MEFSGTKDVGAHQYPKPYKLRQQMYLGFLSGVQLSPGSLVPICKHGVIWPDKHQGS